MRCTGCGLPLSPKHTHCLRCGKAVGEAGKSEKQANNSAGTPQYAFSSLQESNNMPTSVDAFQGQMTFPPQQPTNNPLPDQSLVTPEMAQASGQANQMRLPDPDKLHISSPEQALNKKSQAQSGVPEIALQPFPHSYQRQQPTGGRSTLQPGFAVAGLCVFAGGLILMLVYIISLHLPAISAGNQSLAATTSTPTTQRLLPGSQGNLPAATATAFPTAVPTPALPGKMYIDQAQMASGISFNTAQPSQATTSFKVGQKIFVTFMLHPATTGGAVCLLWYVNQKQFEQFAFPVGPTPQHAYSFAYANSAGQGSVEIYWASSTACTDKVKAQIVSFTITQ